MSLTLRSHTYFSVQDAADGPQRHNEPVRSTRAGGRPRDRLAGRGGTHDRSDIRMLFWSGRPIGRA